MSTWIDTYLRTYDVRTAHRVDVDAPATTTYQATRDLDVGRSIPIMTLFAVRALPHLVTGKARPSRSITLETMLDMGFVILREDEPREFVMGAVGKFWRPDSGLVRLSAEGFTRFDSPGFAKAVLVFTVEEQGDHRSLLATETRVACTDESARRRFLLYWRVIGPFSGLIRHLMLDRIRRTAEDSVAVERDSRASPARSSRRGRS